MDFKNLILEVKDNVAVLTINRPKKYNALNDLTITELGEAIDSIEADDSIDVVIITGAGEKAFVAGADISELNKTDVVSGRKLSEKGQAVFNRIENLDKPVIAAVNGFALGGGCELAMACHIRLASDNAIFGQPEVNLGIIPGYGGTQRLARLINPGRAAEYILTGDSIKAGEAERLGLVNHVYPQTELMEKALDMANKISSKAQVAVNLALKAVVATTELSQNEGQKLEAGYFSLCCGTEDFKEGTGAFLEKRKPNFKNK